MALPMTPVSRRSFLSRAVAAIAGLVALPKPTSFGAGAVRPKIKTPTRQTTFVMPLRGCTRVFTFSADGKVLDIGPEIPLPWCEKSISVTITKPGKGVGEYVSRVNTGSWNA